MAIAIGASASGKTRNKLEIERISQDRRQHMKMRLIRLVCLAVSFLLAGAALLPCWIAARLASRTELMIASGVIA